MAPICPAFDLRGMAYWHPNWLQACLVRDVIRLKDSSEMDAEGDELYQRGAGEQRWLL